MTDHAARSVETEEQCLSHEEWLIREIEKGATAADAGELIDDSEMEAWFRSIGAAKSPTA